MLGSCKTGPTPKATHNYILLHLTIQLLSVLFGWGWAGWPPHPCGCQWSPKGPNTHTRIKMRGLWSLELAHPSLTSLSTWGHLFDENGSFPTNDRDHTRHLHLMYFKGVASWEKAIHHCGAQPYLLFKHMFKPNLEKWLRVFLIFLIGEFSLHTSLKNHMIFSENVGEVGRWFGHPLPTISQRIYPIHYYYYYHICVTIVKGRCHWGTTAIASSLKAPFCTFELLNS